MHCGSRTALALVVAAVAACACNSGEPGIGDCDGASVGDSCIAENNQSGLCVHNCGSPLFCYPGAAGEVEDNHDVCWDDVFRCENEGDACVGGRCLRLMADRLECFYECTTVGDECDFGTCYFVGPNDYTFYCLPTGTKAVGEACGMAADCMAGFQCLDRGGAMSCYQVCDDGTPCPSGTCTDTGLGFNVCVEG